MNDFKEKHYVRIILYLSKIKHKLTKRKSKFYLKLEECSS